ncbi:MAG: protein kinase [Bacteroidetes bacterium]|nr:protein kinase [Bacteroidota bacterium]
MIGKTISHYKILEKLGEGGMGIVYKAIDTKLDRTVALKFLPSSLTSDKEAKGRFIREARAASALDHPNICTIHEINETDEGQMFISMAYYDGLILTKKIEKSTIPIKEVIDIAIQIASGLIKAHQRGIIHRDIKPANIVVTEDGLVKILDFGIAKLISESRSTQDNLQIGTIAHISPEQIRSERIDHRTDIWSLGVVIYEMITRKLPFNGEYDQAIIYSILNEEPFPLLNFRSDVPKKLQDVVLKAISKNVGERFQSVNELLKELIICIESQRNTDGTDRKLKSSERYRKLSAIMFTDMVGYSALTQKNESLAIELLEVHRRLLRPLFQKHGGNEVETIGDAFFVEFKSALEAVRCAIKIQKMLHRRNSKADQEKQIILRIGLHIGDVIHIGKHVHGDGVNIAARLEPLSAPGGICLSEDVVRQIKNKIELPVRNLGIQKLKNIESPVEIYCIEFPWESKQIKITKPALGRTISHYKILAKLGEGGMGKVYKAEDTKLERTVAIKFLPHNISANSEERERFKIEAKAAAALNHPNIATIYAIEEFDNEMFIVMEFIDGKELKEEIKAGPIQSKEAINIATQIAEGLIAAHKKEIIHRDIKSSNIMITKDGKVKIMDFGLAKIKGGTELTKIGSTVGTAAYMSPEQARGEGVDQRTDIWSFGVILYEMLTGQLPFKGDYEQAVIYSILNEEPEPISTLRQDIPIIWEKIVSKLLSANRDERYQNAHELLKDLQSDNTKNSFTTKKSALITKRSKKWISGVAGIVIIAVITILVVSLFNFSNSDSVIIEKSIAVLPFTNLSADPEQEYFADGMAEEIINALAQFTDLKVSSRTSSFLFRGQETDIQTIGEKLGVGTVLEGSVRKSGNKLRVTAQLINVSDGFHLWSNIYERELTDIFVIQDDLTESIVEALQVKLSGNKKKYLSMRKSNNIESYNLYLKGRFYWNKRSEEGVNKSIEYFQQAIDKDSTYALAYAGLGDSYLMLGVYGRKQPIESFSLAKVFIERALQLDNTLAETYASLGDINIHYDWDLDKAESNLKRAIELNPRYANGYHWYSEVFVLRGEFESAYQESHRALELDPYALIINTQLGLHYRRGGEFQKAIYQLLKTIEFDSTFAYAHYDLSIVYVALKQFDRALYSLRKANSLARSDTRILSGLGFAEGFAGNKEEARSIEKALLDRAEKEYVPSHDFAVVSLGLGKKDQALEHLERAFQERSPWMPFLNLNPLFSSLSDHPRFQALLRKMELQ